MNALKFILKRFSVKRESCIEISRLGSKVNLCLTKSKTEQTYEGELSARGNHLQSSVMAGVATQATSPKRKPAKQGLCMSKKHTLSLSRSPHHSLKVSQGDWWSKGNPKRWFSRRECKGEATSANKQLGNTPYFPLDSPRRMRSRQLQQKAANPTKPPVE